MQTVHKQLSELNDTMGGSISNLGGDRILQYNNDKGFGKVVSVELEAGITFLEYDLNLMKSHRFDLDSGKGSVLYFIYCTKGELNYSWEQEDKRNRKISELQTAILGNTSKKLRLYIPEGVDTTFALIKVVQTTRFRASTPADYALSQKLFYEFSAKMKGNEYEYRGTSNLKIREQLSQIKRIKQIGVIRKLMVKGIVHFVLAFELMHHSQDLAKSTGLNTRLNKVELQRVQSAIVEISENPQHSYAIARLCKSYVLSPSKLQEGFKTLTGFTIANFVKKMRIEMAEELLKEGELNISQVVYTIGFTSRSYFSKIFSQRYQCSPKYYQERCRNMASA